MNTKDFPLVSVLIPAYNHENYIQETIESIINQTYPNIELIILDDGSKDKTWKKITELKQKCKNRFVKIHFETKQNEGTCMTLNKLLKLSSGEFVYIIASDDLAKPQAIEKEVKFLQDNPDYSLAVGDNEYVDSMGKQIFRTQKAFTSNIKNAKYKTVKEFLSSKLKIDFLFRFAGFSLLDCGENDVANDETAQETQSNDRNVTTLFEIWSAIIEFDSVFASVKF